MNILLQEAEKFMRLFITTLSLLCVISFGYALAGYGQSLFGGGINAEYVIGGLGAGIIFGGFLGGSFSPSHVRAKISARMYNILHPQSNTEGTNYHEHHET